MRVSLIVAMAENRVIGNAGELPWRLPADLAYFKRVTMGKPVLMGRKTWEAIGRPLPGRKNIVVTRNPAFAAEGAVVVHSLDAALDLVGSAPGAEEVMVIGGEEIYRLALPRADRIYLTEVDLAPAGDARFPDLDPSEWQEASREDHAANGDAPAHSFVVLERVAA